MKDRVILDESYVLVFAPHVRLRFNEPREQWVILAPERLLEPDETAVVILRRLDGSCSVQTIIDDLAKDYDAPRETIAKDVCKLLQDLLDKGFLCHE